MNLKQTIYALSTVNGKSGVAVIRISGEKALNVLKKMTSVNIENIKARYAYFSPIKNAVTNEVLDHALVLYFQAPFSFTGEDIVEIQCHGSRAVISSVLESLSLIDGLRLAEAGEFSRRAFYHQKMDLTEIEGLADLIDAETIEQQKQALRQVSGNLRTLYSSWREKLLSVLAYLEAYIDFPDENLPIELTDKLLNTVFKLKSDMEEHLKTSAFGERLRDGFRVVITGPTNAGKSSLINAVTQRKAVIVSDIPGTTRDAVDIRLDVAGYPVILTDTAGIRDTENPIEKEGIEIAKEKMNEADLILALFDSSDTSPDIFQDLKKEYPDNLWIIAGKADKISDEQRSKYQKQNILLLSSKTTEGISDLFQKIGAFIKENIGTSSSALITRARYREALNECIENLSCFHFNKEIELSAEDIRLAARAIGKITGQIEVDEILDKIFSSFCIGK